MVVGIGGPSNAGKSGLARQLAEKLGHLKSTVLCIDDYVYPKSQLPRIRGFIDWEHPETIRFSQLVTDIRLAANRHELVIVEGFMIYSDPATTSEIDKKIFVEITEEEFRRRKAQDLRWGEVPPWYVDHIWARYQTYGRPPQGYDVLFLNGEEEWPMERILGFIYK